jgi:hypothetical protein
MHAVIISMCDIIVVMVQYILDSCDSIHDGFTSKVT